MINFVLLAAVCLAVPGKPFIIEGKIQSDTPAKGMICLQYEHVNGKAERDTAYIKDNTYRFKGNIEAEGAVRLSLFLEDEHTRKWKGFAQFYAGPGITRVMHQPNFGAFTVSGSPAQADNELLAKQTRGLADPGRTAVERAFIRQHPGSWISYITIGNLFNYLEADTATALYAALDPGLKQYPEVALLGERIKGMGVAAVGTPAPDFAEPDSTGRSVSLSSYRGKYVLLTFWASWCHGCRAENRFLVPAYNKYKDKGFEILGVSLDGGPIGKQLWLKAVAQDKTAWTQISDLKGGSNVAAIQYGVSAIPRNFLLDPKGIVVARDLDEAALNKELEKLYGAPTAGTSGASTPPGTFHLTGKIRSDSVIGGYIYMNYHNKGNLVTDTRDSALLTGNTYHFEGHMTDGAARVVINWGRRPMKVDTGRDQTRSMAIYLSAGDDATVEHTANFHNIQVRGSLMQSEMDSMAHVFSLRQRPPDKIVEDFIRQHPASWLSYLYLDDEVRHHVISPESSVALYAVLDPSLKKYEYVQKMGGNIEMYAGQSGPSSKDGIPAKDFTVNTTTGNTVSLASYRGKYVLLDFWASWCGPCRAENPNLIRAYHSYKDKNFTILSVSLDQSKQAWLDAVKKDGLGWTQASDLKGMTSPVAGLYGISAIPANFLIDPSGKIIATNLRGDELNTRLTQVFSSGADAHTNLSATGAAAHPSGTQRSDNKFVLEGRITSDSALTGKIYLQYEDDGEAGRDSCVLVNNTYHFSGVMKDGAIRANLFWKLPTDGLRFSGFAQFYMAPGKTAVVHKARFNTFEVPGSPIQKDNQWMNNISARHSDTYADSAKAFIRSHPDSWIGYVALENMTRLRMISQDTAAALYEQFSPSLKIYHQPQQLYARIQGMGSTKVGNMAAEFSENDENGHAISLSSFRGKYVLVKFWASWCHPCRAENKVLVPIYHKYKGKGFEVLGVSIDSPQSRDAWLKAVKEDATDWTQIADLQGAQSKTAVKYGIMVVPTSFLVDPQGKIIAKNLMGEELDKRLQELLN